MKKNKTTSINDMIYEIRGCQVMLDEDLAKIYQVETKRLNEAVKRNISRFPSEFMFQLTKEEYECLRSQIVTLNTDEILKSHFATSSIDKSLRSQFATSNMDGNLKSQFVTSSWGGRRKLPYAFTEHGVIMLSSVLNSEIAAQMNIAIVKAFIAMRRYITKPVREKLDDLEKVLMLHIDDTSLNFAEHAATINEIITRLNNLIDVPPKPTRRIGF